MLNILTSTQLGKFGINLNNAAPTQLTLTEKWEGMALAPVLQENAPQDFFLFIGNDNDFLSTTCKVGGQNCAQAVNSDAVVLTYRLTLPTYVDSEYLAAMIAGAPVVMDMNRDTAQTLAGALPLQAFSYLNAGRRLAQGGSAPLTGGRVWGTVDWRHTGDLNTAGLAFTDDTTYDGTVGYDMALSANVRLGAALNYSHADRDLAFGFSSRSKGISGALYGGYEDVGVFVNGLLGYGHVDLDRLRRPSAYGLTASGDTDGHGWMGSVEAGYIASLGNNIFAGPVGQIDWSHLSLDAYTEFGAAGGNIRFPTQKFDTLNYALGAEAFGALGDVTPSLRVVYTWRDDDGAILPVTLASAADPMATQLAAVGTGLGDSVTISLGLQGSNEGTTWFLGYDADIGVGDHRDGTTHRVTAGASFAF